MLAYIKVTDYNKYKSYEMIPERLHKITITWSRPIPLSESLESPYLEQNGLYYITRRYIRGSECKERSLYIGETKRSFKIRLLEHLKNESNWTAYYGRKYVRFGLIDKIYDLDGLDFKHYLRTIETAVIATVSPDEDDLSNISQVSSAKSYFRLHITNKGCRGGIPKEINPEDYE
jgi:hypothetical protein